jgi:hypothetical protein
MAIVGPHVRLVLFAGSPLREFCVLARGGSSERAALISHSSGITRGMEKDRGALRSASC